MKRRFCMIIILALLPAISVRATTIRWVDFQVPYESLRYAMNVDISTSEKENHISWIQILALAGSRSGGKCQLEAVKKATKNLEGGWTVENLSAEEKRLYDYYYEAYDAVLGGLVGHYCVDGKTHYGLKAYSPIAEGYHYAHCSDFGNQRSFGFKRKHLGHDMMGSLGTPVVAVEGGVVEALGWNRYGGWRIGIRSFDSRRYYYYAHLKKDQPFADGLQVGDVVQAGDLIGFMGRTGYSDKENTNNIETVHLHFGMQLVFDESQKECNSEIWIDTYSIVRLLHSHRSSIVRENENWRRKFDFVDLDILYYPDEGIFVEN